jgi:Xaa-Pro dipeptidase
MASVDNILAGKYPAKAHARKVVAYLRQNGFEGDGVIYLEAQKNRLIEDNDSEQPFRSVPMALRDCLTVIGFR